MAHHWLWTIGLCLMCSVTAQAQLSWSTRSLERQASLSDEQIVVEYPFANPTDHPITITALHTSCGCTTAALAKKTYQPKEKGRITATFTIADREGEQNKSIVVQTDDPAESTVILRLKVQVPVLWELSSRFLYWKAKEPLSAKTISLHNRQDQPLQLTNLQIIALNSSRSAEAAGEKATIQVQIKTLEEGQSYELTVIPTSATPAAYELQWQTQPVSKKPLRVYVRIGDPPPPAHLAAAPPATQPTTQPRQ